MLNLKRIPNKKRFITALSGGVPDCVPYYDSEVSSHVVNKILNKNNCGSSIELEPEDLVKFFRGIGMDVVYTSFNWGLGRVYHEDSNGKKHYVNGSIKSRTCLQSISSPDLSLIKRRLDTLCRLLGKTEMGIVLGIISPYKLVKAAVGYQDFLLKVHDDLPFLEEFIEIAVEKMLKVIKELIVYPLDAIAIPGDLCTGIGPMLSPTMIRHLWLESTKKFIQPIKEKNIPIILHMDGDFSSITDIMIETGVDAFHPFEVCGKLDIYEQKNDLSNIIAIMGNIDITGVLLYGSPADVRKDVKKHIEILGKGGGYICGSSHEIMSNITIDNFVALVQAIDDFGNYN